MTYFTIGWLHFLAFKHHEWTNHRSGVRPRHKKLDFFLKLGFLEHQKIFKLLGIFRLSWKKNGSIFFASLFNFLWNDKFVPLFTTWWLLDCNPIVQRCFLFLKHPVIPLGTLLLEPTLSAFCLIKALSKKRTNCVCRFLFLKGDLRFY